jgi:hypothetical protein
MPISYVYDETLNIVFTTASGVLLVDDFIDELKRQRQDDSLPKNSPGLVDLLAVERVVVGQGLSSLIQIADDTIDDRGYAYVALIVTDPALSHLAELLSAGSKSANSALIYEVFPTRKEGQEWLMNRPLHPALVGGD